MYVSAADNDYVGVTGTFLGTASQGVWSTARLDFSVPPGGIAKLHFGAFGGSIPGLVQQSAGTLDLYSMQIRASAFEGESVSVTDLLADSLALTARPRWTGSPRRATWAATSCPRPAPFRFGSRPTECPLVRRCSRPAAQPQGPRRPLRRSSSLP